MPKLLLWSTGSNLGHTIKTLDLNSCGSWALKHRPSCLIACSILLDQGSNQCLLHWQVDSQPLDHQEGLYPTSFLYLGEQLMRE